MHGDQRHLHTGHLPQLGGPNACRKKLISKVFDFDNSVKFFRNPLTCTVDHTGRLNSPVWGLHGLYPLHTQVIRPHLDTRHRTVLDHLGSPGRGGSAQGGAGPRRVHGAIFGDVQGPVQVVHVHQRIQVLGLSRGQDVGLDAVDFTQLEREQNIRIENVVL